MCLNGSETAYTEEALMSRIRLARELAAATGRNLTEATRFIRQVGPDTARRALRGADTRISWRLPALGGIGTGGVLVWREQNIREAEAIAETSGNTMEALSEILASDELTAEQKQKLAESIANQSGAGGGDDTGLGDLLGGDLQQTIVMIVVLLVVLGFAVNYASNIGQTAATGGIH